MRCQCQNGLGGKEIENFGIFTKKTFTKLSHSIRTPATGVSAIKSGLFLKNLEFTREHTSEQGSKNKVLNARIEVYSGVSGDAM